MRVNGHGCRSGVVSIAPITVKYSNTHTQSSEPVGPLSPRRLVFSSNVRLNAMCGLKQRLVFRTAAAYIASSWILLQAVDLFTPIIGLPDSVMRGLAIFLSVGFVPALIVSWIYERLRRDSAAG